MSNWGLSERPRLRPPARVKYDQTRQTDLLLIPERIIHLNGTAGAILQLVDGKRTVSQIVDELQAKYNQASLLADVVEFLSLASEEGWIER
ncbi:pyrroloquinoline quinone biosynthesis peptide chaperone PqqD [Paenibacillus sp. FJAT-27812]|uniref:pyrroloquinoline quinone biosynthesis peptide chaperone PqqD n=1 Tax=Paenibacillus sp. FJAT-27812 TaxID=1684143 RepID=UPI0006A79332|nr:pyrroloquinoline quinone biosynthesis peptide chaperone PqqD [Paenibacillus sp. FJAT-27812]